MHYLLTVNIKVINDFHKALLQTPIMNRECDI